MPAPLYLRHPASLGHDMGPHPERPARIVALEAELAARGRLGWAWQEAPPAPRAALAAVHTAEHLEALEALDAGGGGAIDPDTSMGPGSLAAAVHGAGGAMRAVDAVLGGEAPVAFSAQRPPGHHAERRRAMGFCLLNSVAVAAQHALDAHGLQRVLVVDWDVHHGNGTQDVFWGSDQVLFASIHQRPLYPGTGAVGERGVGAGDGYTLNLPVPPGSGDGAFCSLLEHVALARARAWMPELVLVSAGFDAHADDPLAGCEVTEAGFATMAASLRALAGELGAGLVGVLEGGYALEPLARSVAAVLEVLGEPGRPRAADVPRHELADAAERALAS